MTPGPSVTSAARFPDPDHRVRRQLYLDEDGRIGTFEGLPDADVYRMGVQIEQRAFARLSIPLFAWEGGIAVRRSVEDEVTWDRETLVENTAFVWAAAQTLEELSVRTRAGDPSQRGAPVADRDHPATPPVGGREPPCVEVAPARVARGVLVRAVFVTVVHSMGTVAGILDPPDEFRVTEKANG